MVRKSFALLTLLSLTFACLRDGVVLVSFTLNRSFIASHLCERRDDPDNDCQGRCHLRKQLEDTKNAAQAPVPNTVKETDTLHSLPIIPTFALVRPGATAIVAAGQSHFVLRGVKNPVDHPPETVLS